MKRKDKRNVALFVLRRLIIGVLIMTVAGMLLEGCGNKEERAEKVKAAHMAVSSKSCGSWDRA